MKNLWNWIRTKTDKALLTPIKALKLRYVPLLLIYFSYGLSGFSGVALSFWEKDHLSLSAEQLISIGVWGFVPWTLKMIFGQMVDSVPILGSRRKSYVFLGAILMIVGTVLLAGMAGQYPWIMNLGSQYSLYLLSSVLMTLGFVIQDVAADTMSTEVVETYEIHNSKKIPRSERAIQSELSMVQVLGRLALSLALFSVAGLGGWLAEHFSYEFIFWLTLCLPLISCVGALFVKLEKPEHHLKRPLDKKVLFGGITFAAFSVAMAIYDFGYSQEIVFVVSFALLSTMLYWVTRELSRPKFKTLVFTMTALFIYRMLTLSGIGPGLQWWFIDGLGFDPAFFGVLRQIGATIALIFLWFFADFLANRPVRSVLLILVVLEAVMSLPELGLYYGVHTWLGVSAHTIAMFDTALSSPLTDISMVPMLAMIAYYAPAHYRGTWFAVGASLMNLALNGGQLISKYLNQIFVVTREVQDSAGNILVPQNYDALGWLMWSKVVMGFVIPFVVIMFCFRERKLLVQENEIIEDISAQPPIPSEKKLDM